jgi:hypothetical protein
VILNGYAVAKAGDLVEGHYTNQQNVTRRTFETAPAPLPRNVVLPDNQPPTTTPH